MTLVEGATFLWRTVFASLRTTVFFGALDFAEVALGDRLAGFLAVLALRARAAAGPCAFLAGAFRAGAFLAAARLAIGLDRRDLDLKDRALTDDFAADRREFDRLTPFALGLLIFGPQCPRFKRLRTP